MRPYITLILVFVCRTAFAGQLDVRAVMSQPGEAFEACEKTPCVFTDLQGENVYTVDKEYLRRTTANQQAYSARIAEKSVKVLLAGINKLRSQIIVAFEQASIPTGALFTPGLIAPDAVQRQYWLTVRNPKSGDEIKAIDLGLFRPTALSMTATGDYLWVAGDELQLRKREVRAYNTRSGKLVHNATVDKGSRLRLFERGFQVGAAYYLGSDAATGATVKHNSPNAFSIAEFTVRRSSPLTSSDLADKAIGVVGFQGAKPELREMLEGALAIKLATAGFKVAERQRLKDLLQEAQFQNLGLTDSNKAAELGRLANAEFMLFGQLTTSGTMTALTLRLVSVGDGELRNGIELECRDCTPDDYLQGLTFLIQDWVQ